MAPPHMIDEGKREELRLKKPEKRPGLKEKKEIAAASISAPRLKHPRHRTTNIWEKQVVWMMERAKKREEWPGQRKARRAIKYEARFRAGVPNPIEVDGEDGWVEAPGESDEEEEWGMRMVEIPVKTGERILGENEVDEGLPLRFFEPRNLGPVERAEEVDKGDEEMDDWVEEDE